MRVEWTDPANADLTRLYNFLNDVAPDAAGAMAERLLAAPNKLLTFPRLGAKIAKFEQREIRRLNVGDYELRYEIIGEIIRVVQIWHHRENR